MPPAQTTPKHGMRFSFTTVLTSAIFGIVLGSLLTLVVVGLLINQVTEGVIQTDSETPIVGAALENLRSGLISQVEETGDVVMHGKILSLEQNVLTVETGVEAERKTYTFLLSDETAFLILGYTNSGPTESTYQREDLKEGEYVTVYTKDEAGSVENQPALKVVRF